MIKRKLMILMMGGLLLIPTLACGRVGIYDPQATQVAMQATVSALQATITALETASAAPTQRPPAQPSPQIVVVTATSEARSDPGTVTPTLSPTTSPPASLTTPPTGVSQGQTIPTRVATSIKIIVATLTPTPTPKTSSEAPIITEPPAGTVVEERREALLRWSWNGRLGPDEYFDVKVRPDGQSRSAYVAWERAEAHEFKANLTPGRYFWSVQVIKGSYRKNSGEPEDRLLEAHRSPESEPRLIIVAGKEKGKTRTPTPRGRPTVSPNATEPTVETGPPE